MAKWYTGRGTWKDVRGGFKYALYIAIALLIYVYFISPYILPLIGETCSPESTNAFTQIKNVWSLSDTSLGYKISNSFGAVGNTLKETGAWIAGYKTGSVLICDFIYNLIIGLLGGYLAVFIIVRILRTKVNIADATATQELDRIERIGDNNVAISLIYGFTFAIIMAIPVLNRIIGLITFYSILPNDWAGFIMRILLVGILPAIIYLIYSAAEIVMKKYYKVKGEIREERTKIGAQDIISGAEILAAIPRQARRGV